MEITEKMIEDGAAGMYGKHWHGPVEKQPGENMKKVWRRYAEDCLKGALAAQTDSARPSNGD